MNGGRFSCKVYEPVRASTEPVRESRHSDLAGKISTLPNRLLVCTKTIGWVSVSLFLSLSLSHTHTHIFVVVVVVVVVVMLTFFLSKNECRQCVKRGRMPQNPDATDL